MKKALLLLSFVHLLAACTNDIEILPNDESQKLIVNALINANKTNTINSINNENISFIIC